MNDTKQIKRPARNAHVFLTKKWDGYVSECMALMKRTSLPILVSMLSSAVQTSFEKDLQEAYYFWGSMDIEDALKEIGFHWFRKGMPYADAYERIIQKWIKEKEKELESKKVAI
jgi:hypothetical protein